MNKELEGRIIDIDPQVMEFLRQQPNVSSIDRNKHLLETGKVTYGQLERIMHDFKYLDKKADPTRYNLYGGHPMEQWGKNILKQMRDTVRNTKQSKKIADDIGGERKNAFNKSHTTSMSPKINANDVTKQNSETFSNSSVFSAKSMKLTEEINKIKKLMI